MNVYPQNNGTQQALLKVGKNILVSGDMPDCPHVEPYVAANPKNPKHLIAATMAFTRDDGDPSVTVFISFDGGQKWKRSHLPGLETIAYDPWVAFGADSFIYVGCQPYLDIGLEKKKMSIFVYRSKDGGRSWSEPTLVPFGIGSSYDHETIAVDRTGSDFFGSVYILSSQSEGKGRGIFPISIIRSINNGVTFLDPVWILPNNFNNQNGNIIVLPNGTVLATFFEIGIGNNKGRVKHPRLWVIKSRDGGKTFSNPILVTESFQLSWPVLAVDPSQGPFHDRIYIVWGGIEKNKGTYISHSTDEGETWSAPLQINDDKESKEASRRNPMIAVNKDGVVGVSWLDTRNDPDNKCYNLYFSASSDGGNTFLPNVRVSSEKSCPDLPGNKVPKPGSDVFDAGKRWPSGGDYHGLTASSDGLFHVFWSDSRNGVFQNWTASIKIVAQSVKK